MKYRLIIACVVVLFSMTCFSEENKSVYVKSILDNASTPTAQDLGKYGEVPMNLYAGRANVSIPIYSTTQRGIELNISLSYDTGGLLISQLPSWTGHGWTLNVGGCITRKLQGYYDEDENRVRKVSRSQMPELVNYFNNTRTIDNQTDENIANDVTNAKKVYDYSPDIFVFNFMGKSGRFFFGPDKTWHVQCEENIKVEFDVTNTSNYILPFIPNYPNYTYTMSKTIKGFTLVDENGVRYTFGGTTDAIEYSIGFLDQDREDWRANSWYLTEVKDRFGNVLYKFNYKRGKFIVQLFNNYIQTVVNYEASVHGWGYGSSIKNISGNSNASFPFSATLNAPVYLSNITTQDKTSIDFNLSNDINIPEADFYPSFDSYCKKDVTLLDGTHYTNQAGVPYILNLDCNHGIEANGSNGLYLYYLRNHSGLSEGNMKYWDSDAVNKINSEHPNYAMETGSGWDNPLNVLSFTPLQSIDITNKSNSSVNKRIRYVDFVYNKEPRLHITAVNMYGEDGKTSASPAYSYKMEYNNYSLIPEDYLTDKFDYWGYYNDNSSSPEANPITTQYGMMKRLIYPTGGYSEFIYEQNSYSQCLNDTIYAMQYYEHDAITGGLRIKQINNYDSNGNISKARKFSYFNIGYDTDMSSGQCYRLPRRLRQEIYYANYVIDVKKNIVTYNKKSSVVPLTDSYGSHIGYTWVTETSDNIEKEYKFTNYSDCIFGERPFRVAKTTESWYGVNLNSPYITFTDLGFTRGKLLSERVKENGQSIYECMYQYDYKPSRYVPSTTFAKLPVSNVAGGVLVGCAFKLYYCNFELVKKFEKHYYRDGTSTYDITEYDMTDFTPNSNDLSFSLRKLNSVNLSRMSHDKVLESVKTQYSYLPSETYDYYFPISQIKTFHNGIETNRKTYVYSSFPAIAGHKLLSQEKTQQYPDFSKETVWVSYDQYDKTGLLLQYTERSKGTTYLGWDNYGRLVKIFKGKTKNPSTWGVDRNGNLVKNPETWSDELVTHFGYTVDGKMNQKISPNGYVTNYGYDLFGRLNRVYDKEGDIQTYNYNFKKK